MEWLNQSGHENVGKTVNRIQLLLQEGIAAAQVKKPFRRDVHRTHEQAGSPPAVNRKQQRTNNKVPSSTLLFLS